MTENEKSIQEKDNLEQTVEDIPKENIDVKENDVDEKTVEEIEPKLYSIAEHALEFGYTMNLFKMDLEQLIYEKMFVLFEKLAPLNVNLKDAEVKLTMEKEELLRTLDFKKELGITTKPTIADKEAVMRPFLAKLEDKVEEYEKDIAFYKNKIVIINDLIKMQRLQLRMEAAINE